MKVHFKEGDRVVQAGYFVGPRRGTIVQTYPHLDWRNGSRGLWVTFDTANMRKTLDLVSERDLTFEDEMSALAASHRDIV